MKATSVATSVLALSLALSGATSAAAPRKAMRPAAARTPPAPSLAPTGRWSAYTRGAAKLPPMGWNSWNAFQSDLDEEKVIGSAKVIVDTGLAAKGYRYIDLDDGWWLKRRQPDGRIIIRTDTFPSAKTADGNTSFRPLTDRLHAMGLKAGIYSDMGRNSCAQVYGPSMNQPVGTVAEREVGLYGWVDQDIKLYFQEWGFDLIKVDGCGLRALPPTDPRVKAGEYRALGPFIEFETIGRTNTPLVKALMTDVTRAIEKYNPDDDFIYSLCLWGSADVRSWAKDVGNMSRTSEDIAPNWGRMLHNLDTASRRPLYAHPGSWNDPDMLYIGSGEFDANHLTEARSHFSLWAMLNAPLLIGYDLRKAPQSLLDVWGNQDVIALNQDAAGNQAVLAYDGTDVTILVKTLASGDKAVAILNRTNASQPVTLTAAHLKLLDSADVSLKDLWSGEGLSFRKEQRLTLSPHETKLFRVAGTRKLADGLYLSEMPGSVNPAVDGVVVPEAEPLVSRPPMWSSTRGLGERPRYAGWGGAQADMAPHGTALNAGGKRFETGIGVLANSRLEVRNAGYTKFEAQVGVDDSSRDRSQPVTFSVYGDGKLIARSKPMRYGDAPAALTANVAGVKLVELVAQTPKAARFPDAVTWGEAALRR